MPSSRKASSFNLEGSGKQALLDWALRFGLHISDSQFLLFNLFLSELTEWNKKTNLVGPSTEAGIVRELLLDSLIPCALLPEAGELLDVGSGAGFPAIPIKICKPQLKVRLLEPHRKKCGFLKQVIRVAALKNIEVVRGRLDEGGEIFDRRRFQAITGRAFLPLEQMLMRCGPCLAEGGLMVYFLGRNLDEVLASCRGALAAQRIHVFKVIPYTLPMKGSERHVVFLEKQRGKSLDDASAPKHAENERKLKVDVLVER